VAWNARGYLSGRRYVIKKALLTAEHLLARGKGVFCRSVQREGGGEDFPVAHIQGSNYLTKRRKRITNERRGGGCMSSGEGLFSGEGRKVPI